MTGSAGASRPTSPNDHNLKKKKKTSKSHLKGGARPLGFRVLFCFSFFFLTSIAARILVTFFLSRLGRYLLAASFSFFLLFDFVIQIFHFFILSQFFLCASVSFHFLKVPVHLGQDKGASRWVPTPTHQSFRVCKSNLATSKVAKRIRHLPPCHRSLTSKNYLIPLLVC